MRKNTITPLSVGFGSRRSARFLSVFLLLALFLSFPIMSHAQPTLYETFLMQKLHILTDTISLEEMESDPSAFDYNTDTEGYIVFLSLCNVETRAQVLTGVGDTLQAAYDQAAEKAIAFVSEHAYNPAWVKIDILNSLEDTTLEDFEAVIRRTRQEFYRRGIVLDPEFRYAFMEAEINGNKLVHYADDYLNLENINVYLEQFNKTVTV